MTSLLRLRKIKRVALVDRGSNPRAAVVFYKRDDGLVSEPLTGPARDAVAKAWQEGFDYVGKNDGGDLMAALVDSKGQLGEAPTSVKAGAGRLLSWLRQHEQDGAFSGAKSDATAEDLLGLLEGASDTLSGAPPSVKLPASGLLRWLQSLRSEAKAVPAEKYQYTQPEGWLMARLEAKERYPGLPVETGIEKLFEQESRWREAVVKLPMPDDSPYAGVCKVRPPGLVVTDTFEDLEKFARERSARMGEPFYKAFAKVCEQEGAGVVDLNRDARSRLSPASEDRG